MASYALPVPNTVDTFGAIVDLGPYQQLPQRQFSLNGIAGDGIAIFQSQDNFVTDVQPVCKLGGPATQLETTIARYYRAFRSSIGNPLAPTCNAWIGDAVPTPEGGGAASWNQGGNSFGALGVFGTLDENGINFVVAGDNWMTIDTSGDITLGGPTALATTAGSSTRITSNHASVGTGGGISLLAGGVSPPAALANTVVIDGPNKI